MTARLAVAIGAALLVFGLATRTSADLRSLPRCEEDAVLIGIGAFQDGRWSAYRCGPAVDGLSVSR